MVSARMRFLNITALVKELGDERVSPSLGVRYLIGFLIVGPAPYWAMGATADPLWLWILQLAAVLWAVVIGCRYCYRRNPDPEQFFGNFIAVGFVVAVRFMILGVLLGLCLSLLLVGVTEMFQAAGGPSFASPGRWLEVLGPMGASILGVAFVAALHLLYLWRVGVHLGRLPAPLYRKVRVPALTPTPM